MKILLIDDSREFRDLAAMYLGKELKDSVVVKYEVETMGKPTPDFNWSDYDVVLLDYNLGGGEDGFTWLKEFRSLPGFPPTIILTAEGDEYAAVKAIKLGAADYLNKVDMTPKRLAQMMSEAIDYTPEKFAELEKDKSNAEQLVKKLHTQNKQKKKDQNEIDVGSDYRIVRMIGHGAMSRVYLAERTSDRLSLVLKILDIKKVSHKNYVKRFVREAELLAGLESPFVCRIYDHGITEEYGFIAMEFFSRGDLKQRMELNLTPGVAFNYLTHIAYGLDAIHKINIVHRDLKPANIMFRGDDSLALADFGISKKIDAKSDLTTMGQVIGTPHYISPEQGEGKAIDQRSDIYSAGVLLYELLTGKKPFTASSAAAVIYRHVHAEIPTLPEELSPYQEIINKALAKKPEDRFQTAAEFIKVLEEAEKSYN